MQDAHEEWSKSINERLSCAIFGSENGCLSTVKRIVTIKNSFRKLLLHWIDKYEKILLTKK